MEPSSESFSHSLSRSPSLSLSLSLSLSFLSLPVSFFFILSFTCLSLPLSFLPHLFSTLCILPFAVCLLCTWLVMCAFRNHLVVPMTSRSEFSLTLFFTSVGGILIFHRHSTQHVTGNISPGVHAEAVMCVYGWVPFFPVKIAVTHFDFHYF